MEQARVKKSLSLFMFLFMIFSFWCVVATTAMAVVMPARGTFGPGGTVRGVIDRTGYTHTYIFTLSSDSEVLFRCATVDGPNVGVTVSDRNKELMFQDRQTINTKLPLAAGTYYIDVYGNYGAYTLTSSATPQPLANDREPNDKVSNAVPMGLNSRMTGHAGYRSLRNYTDYDDIYRIVLPSAGKLGFSISKDATLTVSLGLSGENNVSYGAVYSDPLDLKAGTYYLTVHTGGYGGYTLSNAFTTTGGVVSKPQPPVNPPYNPPVNPPIQNTGRERVIFEDSFARPDSGNLGPQWQEFLVRLGTGSSNAKARRGDTPWCIKGNALHFEYTGDSTYTEDFIQTVNTFPVNNTRVEFEIRATAATSRGYVGPTALWTTAGDNRVGAYNTSDGMPHIGVYASYRWEKAGRSGMGLMLNGGQKDYPDGIFSGVNQNTFAKHVIIVRNGQITYQSPNMGTVTINLVRTPSYYDSNRHFSFGARLYDQGIRQVIDIRNLRITSFQ